MRIILLPPHPQTQPPPVERKLWLRFVLLYVVSSSRGSRSVPRERAICRLLPEQREEEGAHQEEERHYLRQCGWNQVWDRYGGTTIKLSHCYLYDKSDLKKFHDRKSEIYWDSFSLKGLSYRGSRCLSLKVLSIGVVLIQKLILCQTQM